MNIRDAFDHARAEKRTAFISYLTAGDPDLVSTRRFVKALATAGSDIIELGVPFSDPVADGPTNQAAATRALQSGTTLTRILALVGELRADGLTTPLILFTYLNPIYRMGYEAFATAAKKSGASGVLCVDLPPEEAARHYLATMKQAGLDTVFLASPTTSRERLALIDAASSGFVYYASRTGVTGMQNQLSTSVIQELQSIKSIVKNPIAVGFGISTPAHARALAPSSDAIVVGSAFVDLIARGTDIETTARKITELTQSLTKELKKC